MPPEDIGTFMRQQLRRWCWAAVALLAVLIVFSLGALSRSWSENGPSSWIGELDGRVPSVSAPPLSPPTNQRSRSGLVKAFAEIDGRLYRIIVAPSLQLERRAVLWSAAVSDDERPR